jgi:hypothetical protein
MIVEEMKNTGVVARRVLGGEVQQREPYGVLLLPLTDFEPKLDEAGP